jgi:hypothetical protein
LQHSETSFAESTEFFRVTLFALRPGMTVNLPQLNAVTEAIIGAAIKVHRGLGPGLLESVYLACLVFELHRAKLRVKAQVRLPVQY